MSAILTQEEIDEYAEKMGVHIDLVPARRQNMQDLRKHINKHDMCQGYIITSGKEDILHLDSYKMKDVSLYEARRNDNDLLVGFVMMAKKYKRTNHGNLETF